MLLLVSDPPQNHPSRSERSQREFANFLHSLSPDRLALRVPEGESWIGFGQVTT